jgi:hypothetical protein
MKILNLNDSDDNILLTPHKNLVEKVKLTKLPMACLIASTTHQDKE